MTSSRICFIFSFFACSAASACDVMYATHLEEQRSKAPIKHILKHHTPCNHSPFKKKTREGKTMGKKKTRKKNNKIKTPLPSNITAEVYLFVLAQNAGHLFHFRLQVFGLFPLTFLLFPLTFLLFLLPASSCPIMPPERGWVWHEGDIFWEGRVFGCFCWV